ncbi:hypothetical protein BGZ74_005608, partial [Mortierella antarctica]
NQEIIIVGDIIPICSCVLQGLDTKRIQILSASKSWNLGRNASLWDWKASHWSSEVFSNRILQVVSDVEGVLGADW